MDPNTCWLTINELIYQNRIDEAKPHILALKKWINDGGFRPNGFDFLLFDTMVMYATTH